MERPDVIETPEKYSSPEDFVHYITPYVKDVTNIYEIGSMDGRDGRILHRLFPGTKLYMFEGLKANFDGFLGNQEDEENFHVVFSDKEKEAIFWQNEENGIHSLHAHDNGRVTGVPVVTRRLDRFIQQRNLPAPEIVKLDVEGTAYEVLKGFGKYLKTIKALHVETETAEYFKGQVLEDKVWKLLEEAGLTLIQFNRNTVDHRGTQCDSIWVKI